MRSLTRTIALAIVAIVLAACGASGGATGDAAATVDDATIDRDLLERIVVAQLQGPDVPAEGEERAAAEAETQRLVLTTLIGVEVVEQLAEDVGIEVTDEDIETAYDEQVELAGGQEAFDQFLTTIGLTAEEYRDVIVADLARRNALTAELGEEVTDEAVQAAYDEQNEPQIDSRHILVETEEEAEDALARIEDGEDFAEVAMDVSIDGSAEQGGDLGPAAPATFVPEFADALRQGEVGEVLGPVETQFGFHIIEILEVLEAPDQVPFEEAEPQIRAQLQQAAGQSPELVAAFEEAYDEAQIEVAGGLGEWDPEARQVVDPDAVGESDDPAAPGGQVPGDQAPGDQAPGDQAPDGGGDPTQELSEEELQQLLEEELGDQAPDGSGETPAEDPADQ